MIRRVPLIFWIVLLSFLIRLVFIIVVPPAPINLEGDDSALYNLTALQMREYFQKGGVFLNDFFTGRLFHGGGMLEKYGLEIPWGVGKRGLTYPLFVALIYWAFGPHPFFVFIIQAFLMSLASGLAYGIGKELGKPKVGLLGAFLMGSYPPFIFITSKLFQESLSIFLFTLFYFLAFRSWQKRSAWLFSVTGGVLFLLSLSRPPLVFFPFFLFAAIVLMGCLLKRTFSLHPSWLLPVSFLIPYGIWAMIVSWQFQHPAIFVTPVGRDMLTALVPYYGGWIPDAFQGNQLDRAEAEVLRREGILEASGEGKWTWPSKPQMIRRSALKIFWHHPWTSVRMRLDKFRRLWWRPYDWPWKEFLLPAESLRWFHRFLVMGALLGGILWFFERPLSLCFLFIAPSFYGTFVHSFFQVEGRYGLPWLTLMPLMAGFLIHFLWRNRKILFTPFRKVMVGLGIVLRGGLVFHLSCPAFLLVVFQQLNAREAYLLGIGLQSVLLIGFFLITGLWLRPALSQKRLLITMGLTVLLIGVSFETHAFTREDWQGWETQLYNSWQAVQQEIFLPRGTLEGSLSQNLRIDLRLPKKGEIWDIRVNGKSIGTLETLKLKQPAFLLTPPYRIYLREARRKTFEIRQWFSIPIPSQFLKEEGWNTIEIRSRKEGTRAVSPADPWVIFGDYPLLPSSSVFLGPFFHHSMTETSVTSFFYNDDFRLTGRTPLHHQGVKASYGENQHWRSDDLSPSRGVQKGEYRIRIEVELFPGEFLVY